MKALCRHPIVLLAALALGVAPAAAQTILPNALTEAYSGTYYPPDAAGQGMAVDIRRRADGSHDVFVAYFGYGADGDNHWLAGSVPTAPGASVAVVPVFALDGGAFASALDPTTLRRAPFGTLSLEIDPCSFATVRFEPTAEYSEHNPFPRRADQLLMVPLLPRAPLQGPCLP
jgi:hypothetical protein